MVKEFLKMAGVRSEEQFYKKYPSEEAFFRAHPQAQQLVHQKMTYGGMYAYQDGGQEPISSDYSSMAAFKAADDAWQASQGIPQVDQTAYELPVAAPVTAPVAVAPVAAAQQHFALNPYQGVSVYDMLQAQGKAGDLKSRKALAQTIGIPNYTGRPDQNAQMMEIIRQNPDVLLNYTGASAPMVSAKSLGTKKRIAPVTETSDNSSSLSQYRRVPGSRNFKFTDADMQSFNESPRTQYDLEPRYVGMSPEQKGLYNEAWKHFQQDVSEGRTPHVPRDISDYYVTTEWDAALKDFQEQTNPKVKTIAPAPKQVVNTKNVVAASQPKNNIEVGPNSMSFGSGSFLERVPINQPQSWAKATPRFQGNLSQPWDREGKQNKKFYGEAFQKFKSQMEQGKQPFIPYNLNSNVAKIYEMALKDWKDQTRMEYGGTYAKGGAYGNVPQHGQPQGPNNGTYYQGGYFQAGGSYNPTSVDYGDALPQFAMGYDVPTAMYGMSYGGPTYSDVTQYNHQGDVPAFDWMGNGGTPCYNCGGMYQDGGSPLYSTQGQTLRNFTNTLANSSGWSPYHTTLPTVGPNNRGNGSRTPAGLPNLGRGLTIPMNFQDGGMYDARAILNTGPYEGRALVNRFADGGLVKGGEYDMNEDEIQNLIAQGYKIQYI